MSDTAGWHPDASDPHLTRYWDGAQWTAERRWDGSSWVDQTVGATPASSAASPAATTGFPMSKISWILFGGALVAALGALFPWEEVSALGVSETQRIAGGGVFFLLCLVALAVWAAWPSREGALSNARLIGLALVVAAMTFFVFAKFSAISDDQAELDALSGGSGSAFGLDMSATAEPGLGLWLWTTGVVALWVGTFKAWRARTNQG
jgi:hypothetical protein